MRNLMRLLLLSVLCPLVSTAQNPDYKFGKVPLEELQMTTYDKDPEAEAVILYESTELCYQIHTNIVQITDYCTRIKILKPEGDHFATVYLPYFIGSQSISSIDAAAYNLVDGKVVKTPMKKDYLFRERASDNVELIKFSIPEVREGSVIEYRYRSSTTHSSRISTLDIQHSVPTVYCRAYFSIPDFFRFNCKRKGFVPFSFSEQTGTLSLAVSAQRPPISLPTREILCEARDVPAMKKEPYVWCRDDHMASLDFELSQVAMPGKIVQSFTSQWKDVTETLLSSSFHSQLSASTPYKDEIAAIKAQNLSETETLRAILRLVQSKISWNDETYLYSENPRAAADKGSGSNADINSILNASIKAAGFKTKAILLSPRSRGRLPVFNGTLSDIRTFVLSTEADGQVVYLDATSPYSDLNILPLDLQVEQARIYGIDNESAWVNLSALSRNIKFMNINARIDESGLLKGSIVYNEQGYPVMESNEGYHAKESENVYLENLERSLEIEISDYTREGAGNHTLTEKYSFSKQTTASDQYLYINPILVPPFEKNPFSDPKRIFPIELSYPVTYIVRSQIELPEGWTIDETPENTSLTMANNGPSARYIIGRQGNILHLQFKFTIDRLCFSPDEYTDLSSVYNTLIQLCNGQVVLKKE